MISLRASCSYCKDDISLIENYDEAINSNELYDCHHKLEIELNVSSQYLIKNNLYYNRPASELIFLTHKEHAKLHRPNCKFTYSKEYREKQSKISSGRRHLAKNGCKSVFVKIEKIQYYLDLGYHFGRK